MPRAPGRIPHQCEDHDRDLKELGIWHIGGENCTVHLDAVPERHEIAGVFDDLLAKANVVGTPGSGFGKNGEGFFRLTAFGTTANTKEAMERIKKVYGK
ncbi:MAG: hypothetical protein ACLR8P_18900 [Clostridium fessum]